MLCKRGGCAAAGSFFTSIAFSFSLKWSLIRWSSARSLKRRLCRIFLARKLNDFQRLECMSRQISSRCERYTILRYTLLFIQFLTGQAGTPYLRAESWISFLFVLRLNDTFDLIWWLLLGLHDALTDWLMARLAWKHLLKTPVASESATWAGTIWWY